MQLNTVNQDVLGKLLTLTYCTLLTVALQYLVAWYLLESFLVLFLDSSKENL